MSESYVDFLPSFFSREKKEAKKSGPLKYMVLMSLKVILHNVEKHIVIYTPYEFFGSVQILNLSSLLI